MHDVLRRDGSTVILADHDPDDLIVVEAVITSFAPVRGASHCACGAPLEPWSLRCTAAPAPSSTAVPVIACTATSAWAPRRVGDP
jgi:hypothetical protein